MRIAFLNPQGNFDQEDSHLTEHPDFGGQLVYVKELSLALARMGVDVDIVTRLIDDPDWPEFSAPVDHYDDCRDRLRILRIPCGGPDFLEKERLWPHMPEFVHRIRELYAGSLPDYATAHYADGGYVAALLQESTGIGFTFTGHSLGAQKMDKLGMNTANADDFENRFRFSRRIHAERESMRRADSIVTSTGQERMEQYAHPLYHGAVDPADDARFDVIPPGVNGAIFNGSSDGDAIHAMLEGRCGDAREPYILVSSRLDQKKNIAGVVEAYVRSEELRRHARLALFVRGVSDPFTEIDRLPEAERPVLEPILARIDETGIRDRVVFLDIRSQHDLAAAYRFFAERRSVFVLSSFYEPFGLAPIEAAACGLAVAATRNGGPSEIFADGSAVLIDPSDPLDIADGIGRALADFARYSEAGRRRVSSTYTWDQTARGYLGVIERNVARSRPRPTPVGELDASALIGGYLGARS